MANKFVHDSNDNEVTDEEARHETHRSCILPHSLLKIIFAPTTPLVSPLTSSVSSTSMWPTNTAFSFSGWCSPSITPNFRSCSNGTQTSNQKAFTFSANEVSQYSSWSGLPYDAVTPAPIGCSTPIGRSSSASMSSDEVFSSLQLKRLSAVHNHLPWEQFEYDIKNTCNDSPLYHAVNEMIDFLKPTHLTHMQRQREVARVQDVVQNSLGIKLLSHGSFELRTYLPDANINLSAFFTRNHDKTWIQRIIRALAFEDHVDTSTASSKTGLNDFNRYNFGGALSSSTRKEINAPRGVNVKEAEFKTALDGSRSIHIVVSDIPIEIGSNQGRSLTMTAMLEEIDQRVGRHHLFKRATLLCKFTLINETRLAKFISTPLLHALLLRVFAAPDAGELDNPLQVLVHVLALMESLGCARTVLTPFGCLPVRDITNLHVTTFSLAREAAPDSFVTPKLLGRYSQDYRNAPGLKEDENGKQMFFKVSEINVMDPLDTSMNLAKSIGHEDAQHVRSSASKMLHDIMSLISSFGSDIDEARRAVQQLFPLTFERYASETIMQQQSSCDQPLFRSWHNILETSHNQDTAGDDALAADHAELLESVKHAGKFEMPRHTEAELVELMKRLLAKNGGTVTVGKMGSLMHNATNFHSLPAMIKSRFGGLKKLLRRHENVFHVASDHPHNPHVSLWTPLTNTFPRNCQLSSMVNEEAYQPYSSMMQEHSLFTYNKSAKFGALNSNDERSSFFTPIVVNEEQSSSVTPMLMRASIVNLAKNVALPTIQNFSASPRRSRVDETHKNEFAIDAEDDKVTDDTNEEDKWARSKLNGRKIPQEFHCELSGRVMKHPVVTPAGHVFEQSTLENWIMRNGNASPVTGKQLAKGDTISFVPNVALKKLIDQLVAES